MNRLVLFLLFVLSVNVGSSAFAGIFITTQVTVDNHGLLDPTADVTVNIFGKSDQASDLVHTWALSAQISPIAISGLTVTQPTTGSNWSAGPAGGTQGNFAFAGANLGNGGIFAGYRPAPPQNPPHFTGDNQVIPGAVGVGDLIGTMTFSVAKTASIQSFDVITAQSAAFFFNGNGPIDQNGFFEDDRALGDTASSAFIKLPDNLSLASSNGSGSIGALAAVPEPSSALLCGMGLLGLVGYRRRRVA